jgi:16S rRNA (cytosine967-C5)-methyltransferase
VKLHHNLCRAVAETLHRIFGAEQFYADKAIEAVLKADPRRGARDRAFIASNTYEIVRKKRLFVSILGREPETVSDWWEVLGVKLALEQDEPNLPHWPEWASIPLSELHSRLDKYCKIRAIRESIPDWLDTLGAAELGNRWDSILSILNTTAPVALRVNSLKSTREQAIKSLKLEGIDTIPAGEEGLFLKDRASIFRSRTFQSGMVEVQDISSQEVAPFLGVEPGMTVVDACAGGGGKTLHLAALMRNSGRLIALDTEAWKLDELRKRAKRAGAHCIETRPITSSKIIKRLHGQADCLLLDVPCSGLGVLRRNPDSKWKLSPEQIDNLCKIQKEILERYSPMLKPGGCMVYATCSILPSENELQLQHFLETHATSFRLIKKRTILPGENDGDGFFMALLQRLH